MKQFKRITLTKDISDLGLKKNQILYIEKTTNNIYSLAGINDIYDYVLNIWFWDKNYTGFKALIKQDTFLAQLLYIQNDIEFSILKKKFKENIFTTEDYLMAHKEANKKIWQELCSYIPEFKKYKVTEIQIDTIFNYLFNKYLPINQGWERLNKDKLVKAKYNNDTMIIIKELEDTILEN